MDHSEFIKCLQQYWLEIADWNQWCYDRMIAAAHRDDARKTEYWCRMMVIAK